MRQTNNQTLRGAIKQTYQMDLFVDIFKIFNK